MYNPDYNQPLNSGLGSFARLYKSLEKPEETIIKIVETKYVKSKIYDDTRFLELTQRHPFLTQIYQIIVKDELSYIAMEFLLGLDLFDLICDKNGLADPIIDDDHNENYVTLFQKSYGYLIGKKKLSIKSNQRVKNITKKILEALAFLHQNNIIHHDIKPENIRIFDDDNIKLFDYDFACYTNKLPDDIAGSLSYSAPELFKCLEEHNNNYDAKIDIWSLGCIVFTMMEAKVLYDEDRVGIYADHGYPSYLYMINQNIWDDELLDMIGKMLVINPKTRLSANALLSKFYHHVI